MPVAAILAEEILAEVGEISDRRSRPVRRAEVRLALVIGDREHDLDHQSNDSQRQLAAWHGQ
jgi:hypothetical protein